jgi:hypothetical protein
LTLDSTSRIVTHASSNLIQLLDQQDPTGTRWPSKQDQQLCFTTLVTLNGQKRQKRLLTCEHPDDDTTTTTILCTDIAALDQLHHALFNLDAFTTRTLPTAILRMNPYGVIQSAFGGYSTSFVGNPLMRFIHNDDIPLLCNKLRQVTRYQEDSDEDENDDNDDDNEFTSSSFDLRCDFSSLFDDDDDDNNNNKYAAESLPEKDTFLITDTLNPHYSLYHFTTVVTSTQDIVCIMRPSSISCSGLFSSTSQSRPSVSRQCTPKSTVTTLYRLSCILRTSCYKVKHILQKLQQALWDAAEQGLMILAHYLAMIMVLVLQCYRLARHPSFWLEISELALRCLVAETKTRSELVRVFSWLEWSGLPSHRFFSTALDHGSEWLISSMQPSF